MREVSPLAGAPLFGLLSRRLQDEIVGSAHPLRLPAQDWLFRQGEAGDRVYLVVSGRLRVVAESGDEARALSVLGPGAVLGELAVLTRAPRSASVQALRDTDLLELDRRAVRGASSGRPRARCRNREGARREDPAR